MLITVWTASATMRPIGKRSTGVSSVGSTRAKLAALSGVTGTPAT
jgi:hypothetical protein